MKGLSGIAGLLSGVGLLIGGLAAGVFFLLGMPLPVFLSAV